MPRNRKTARKANDALARKLRDDARKRRSLEMLSLNGFSHTLEEHVNVDDIHVLDRLLSEHQQGGAMSRYPSHEHAEAVVSAIVARFADDIAQIGPRSRKHAYVARLSELGMKGAGLHGILRDPVTGRIYEVTTDCARLVLTGNTRKNSPYRITDISSYPCMIPDDDMTPHLERTKRCLLPELRRTAFYATAEPLLKAYLEQCCDRRHNTHSRWSSTARLLTIDMYGAHMPKHASVRVDMRQDGSRVEAVMRVEATGRAADGSPQRSVSERKLSSASDWDALEKRFPQDGRCARWIAKRASELTKSAPKPIVSADDIMPSL